MIIPSFFLRQALEPTGKKEKGLKKRKKKGRKKERASVRNVQHHRCSHFALHPFSRPDRAKKGIPRKKGGREKEPVPVGGVHYPITVRKKKESTTGERKGRGKKHPRGTVSAKFSSPSSLTRCPALCSKKGGKKKKKKGLTRKEKEGGGGGRGH